MKKYIIYIALVTLTVVGCQTEPDLAVIETATSNSLIVSLPQSDDTRVALTDGESSVTLAWESDDKFTIYKSSGERVVDFQYSTTTSDDLALFISADDAISLEDNVEYVAIYPSVSDVTTLDEHRAAINAAVVSQAQKGAADNSHLSDNLMMESSFTYSTSSNTKIVFEHKMATIRFTFELESGSVPTSVIFDDGTYMSYTLTFEETTATDTNLYTANYVILPNESGDERTLYFYVYTNGTDLPEVFSVTSSSVYTAGVQYRSELSVGEFMLAINSAEALYSFYELVASGKSDASCVLLCDIDLEGNAEKQWTPIGTNDSRFAGTIDGNGYTISGLYINSENSGLALVGYSDGATIKNLTIEANITGTTNETAAAFIGYAYNSTITACETTAATTISCAGNNAAGFAGYILSVTISDCINNATIIGARNFGGIAGYTSPDNVSSITNSTNNGAVSDDNATSSKNSNIGGIVGVFPKGTISGCVNNAEVKSVTGGTIGGIAGNTGGTSYYPTISDCINNGDVVSTNDNSGGIIGYASYSIVEQCKNYGEVSGGSNTAGIIGDIYYKITINDCHNYGSISSDGGSFIGGIAGDVNSSTITNCYNAGDLNITNSSTYNGGIAGYPYSTTIANCHNSGSINTGIYSSSLASNLSSSSYLYSSYNRGSITGNYYPGSIVGMLYGEVYGCYNNSDNCSLGSVGLYKYTSTSTTYNPSCQSYNLTTAQMQSADFVDVMNSEAYLYNQTSPSIYAYGWSMGDDGYPQLDSSVTPTLTTKDVTISSAEEFKKIGNEGFYQAYNNYTLTVDVDLEDASWSPIIKYTGTFDGGGYSVTGLSVSGQTSGQGLFCSSYGATIKNIKVGGSVSSTVSHVAIIVGKAYNTTFDNCATLAGSSVTQSSGDSAAGIAGYSYENTFVNCVNRASVTGVSYAAGITGYANQTTNTSYTNCYNEGDIVSTNNFAGGIVAKMVGTTSMQPSMINCGNIGFIKGTYYVGGLTGANASGLIYNSYNLGDIEGTNCVGGLVGIHEQNSSNGINAILENCYTSSRATASDDSTAETIGLGVGKCNNSTINNCYYNDSQDGVAIGSDDNSQSIAAYTTLAELLNTLNTNSSSISGALEWVEGSGEYPTFNFIWELTGSTIYQ